MKEFLRRVLRPLVTCVLRVHSRPLQLTNESCIIIAPHQDDEALGCAGLVATRRAANLPIEIIYITDGAGSHPLHPRLQPAEIARIRRAEAILAMRQVQLPESSLHFLDAPDGTLDHLGEDAFEEHAQRLATLLASLQPAVIFLPSEHDGSSEHTAAFLLVQRALQHAKLTPRLLEYAVWARWRPQQLLPLAQKYRQVSRLAFPASLAKKRAALAAYVSQAQPTPPWTDPVLPRGFIRSFESAEEYYFEH